MDSKGFSLPEVTICLAVIAIASSLSFGSLSNAKPRAMADQQAEQVRAALVKARMLAQTSLDCVDVQIAPHQINLTRYHVCSPSLSNPVSSESISIGSEVTLSPIPSGTQLTFTGTGSTTQTNSQTVVATSSAGKVYQFVILSTIGAVRAGI